MCIFLKVIFCILLSLYLGACSGERTQSAADTQTLTIHAAVSLSAMVRELGAQFAEDHGLTLHYNFASSGALARQLIAAPRGEIYLSANQQWMQRAREAHAVQPATVSVLFANQLAMVAHPENPIQAIDSTEICSLPLTQLSIGDPDYVPAGLYARSWLQSLHCGDHSAWDAFKDKVIPATDAHAALARVQASRQMVGIVYKTDYLAQADSLRLIYSVPQTATAPIHYYGAVVSGSAHSDVAADFLEYIGSEASQAIVEKYGFTPVKAAARLTP
ncbi:molybdate ABC transporter substrate-binding protein [Coraliomargarita algicola]|uniref:Molybdate ABC transporter substrate-binding protein n=1 Tax=Coraliomargarita algicola TaxID=3092156 RepID=A0ABZ0RMZ1_9BACT|nr:molybdate ABC transporter substrate-binding protein [Coraliomargarita sp. J2-16]WPJ97590.1 molybdate ABC transporter substrate-binding protein [Coraliomargarita sp. J2-16]